MIVMSESYPQDLVRHIAASTGLPEATATRVVADVAAYFGETVEDYVRRRHNELKRQQRKNDEIWPQIAAELGTRRFSAQERTSRQLRRIVYGGGKPAKPAKASQDLSRQAGPGPGN
jgi:hypothetical protein